MMMDSKFLFVGGDLKCDYFIIINYYYIYQAQSGSLAGRRRRSRSRV